MKFNYSFLLLLLSTAITGFSQENYILEINGKKIPIELDRDYNATINGKPLSFKVHTKDTLTYNAKLFSLQHLKGSSIMKTDIDNDVVQYAIFTAEGGGLMIQEYGNINPEMMKELILHEITKENISYGYKLVREDYKRKLKSGEEIDVIRAVLKYRADTSIYEVTAVGGKDQGILITTMIPEESMAVIAKEYIALMWHSLKYND